jgi:signal peptidase I
MCKPRIDYMMMTTRKPRRKPKEGDVKVLKDGRKFVRKQCRHDGAYCVRNGRPVYEWVLMEENA